MAGINKRHCNTVVQAVFVGKNSVFNNLFQIIPRPAELLGCSLNKLKVNRVCNTVHCKAFYVNIQTVFLNIHRTHKNKNRASGFFSCHPVWNRATGKTKTPVQNGLFVFDLFVLFLESKPLFKVAENAVAFFVSHFVCLNIPASRPLTYIVFPGKHSRWIVQSRYVVAFRVRLDRLLTCPPFTFRNNSCLVVVFHNAAAIRAFVADSL